VRPNPKRVLVVDGALSLCESFRPELIITDVRLPGLMESSSLSLRSSSIEVADLLNSALSKLRAFNFGQSDMLRRHLG
jgi:hypothetical protein